ncbi:M13 family metallopeptidase [Azospirillum sp. B4]|uniref:M13 family metallopeptidase n=1 Tax=Azospirillum sp. B4 TaxID=95605 RepID=UPI0005CA14D7|nr:M13 family metallopeptidase [Azospirillum sp. B4]
MRRLALALAWFLLSSGLSSGAAFAQSGPASGIQEADLDRATRPQDDFYRFAVGGWIDRTQGPAYMPGWNAGREMQLGVYEALNRDLQALGTAPGGDPNNAKLADLYAGFMDEAAIGAAVLAPLKAQLAQIDAARTPADITRAIAMLGAHNLDIGFGVWVHADDQDPTRYLADFVQSDLGLPDRDYYVDDAPRFKSIHDAYRGHVERVLTLSGVSNAGALAKAVVTLETRLATAQWTETATRVPGATAHRQDRAALATVAPGLDLALYASAVGIPDSVRHFNVGQDSFFTAYGRLLTGTPAPVWRAYLRLRLLDNVARLLPRPYREEADAFYGATLRGATASRPRWLRAMGYIEDTMGDALGRLYVQRYSSPETERKARQVLDTIVQAFRQRIQTLAWMGPESRRGALAKLDQLVIRLGAPDHIRDYTGLTTDPHDPVGNWLRARGLQFRETIAKLERPVDREEWTMTPQSVNGYYSVSRNQVVLPAALLRPPNFQVDADDAVNYGALGWFIAHELSHAFDRAGSRYDGRGARVEWMTPQDRAEFEKRAQAVVAQYARYEATPGHPLDGELTVGENIADISGLAIAYDAYHQALNGRPAPVLDGWTGDQRFFLAFARQWAAEPIKTEKDLNQALADTHAPAPFRVKGSLVNLDAYYQAFDVRPGDGMYVRPADRVHIW